MSGVFTEGLGKETRPAGPNGFLRKKYVLGMGLGGNLLGEALEGQLSTHSKEHLTNSPDCYAFSIFSIRWFLDSKN